MVHSQYPEHMHMQPRPVPKWSWGLWVSLLWPRRLRSYPTRMSQQEPAHLRRENTVPARGSAGDSQPTPVESTGVDDRRDHEPGDRLSFPERTNRHGPRRYAGEPAQARRSLLDRQNLFRSHGQASRLSR